MGRDEARLWSLLEGGHQGRANAIKEAIAARQLGWATRKGAPDTRRLQQALRDLRIEHGALIDAACSDPYGLYVIQSEHELEGYLTQIRNRSRENRRLLAAAEAAFEARLQRRLAVEPTPVPAAPTSPTARRRCRFCQGAWARLGSDYCTDFHEQLWQQQRAS